MIDYKLLAEQKATLLDIVQNGLLTKQQKEHLDGLVGFIDIEQDSAADRLPLGTVVFMDGEVFRDADNQIVDIPNTWKPGPKWSELVEDLLESGGPYAGVIVVGIEEYNALNAAVNEEDDND